MCQEVYRLMLYALNRLVIFLLAGQDGKPSYQPQLVPTHRKPLKTKAKFVPMVFMILPKTSEWLIDALIMTPHTSGCLNHTLLAQNGHFLLSQCFNEIDSRVSSGSNASRLSNFQFELQKWLGGIGLTIYVWHWSLVQASVLKWSIECFATWTSFLARQTIEESKGYC